jgi:deazaflavin-dependent oxidoreductase (nitroreductase family)
MSLSDFFTRLNPVFAWILRSPFHGLVSPAVLLLTVTGRRSGRRYTIPVGYQRDGEVLVVLVSHARRKQWWRNYREPAPVALRLRGRERRGRAELVPPGSDAFRRHAERAFERMPWLGGQFGIATRRGVGLSDAQLAHLGREGAIVEIRLEPA